MSLLSVANLLASTPPLFQEFFDRFSKYGDKAEILFAKGLQAEVPIV